MIVSFNNAAAPTPSTLTHEWRQTATTGVRYHLILTYEQITPAALQAILAPLLLPQGCTVARIHPKSGELAPFIGYPYTLSIPRLTSALYGPVSLDIIEEYTAPT